MQSVSFLPFVLLFFLLCTSSTSRNHVALASGIITIDAPLLTSKLGTNRTILVGTTGKEDFTSLQAAIDSVPDGNNEWVIIHLRAGVYREKVAIPEKKPYIFLRGNGRGRTSIVWNESSTVNKDSATFTVNANNFIAFGISFKNEAPIGVANTPYNQSVAAMVAGDKAAFYHCAFYSPHNTLFDYKGRHYYESCYIQGNIDFIFGRGTSIFQATALLVEFSVFDIHRIPGDDNMRADFITRQARLIADAISGGCEIFVLSDKRTEILGSITAQNRQSQDDDSGFVFLKGKIYGVGGVFLGRAKGAYARVIFAKTYISRTIVPEGWTKWSYEGSTDHLLLGEHECHGPGADRSKRVPWSRDITNDEVNRFLNIDFISGKEWLPVYYY